MDKENGQVPKLIHALNEELRIAKVTLVILFIRLTPCCILQLERTKYLDKLTSAEKMQQRQYDEISRLQHQIKDYQAKLRVRETEDIIQVRADNNLLRKEVTSLSTQLDVS